MLHRHYISQIPKLQIVELMSMETFEIPTGARSNNPLAPQSISYWANKYCGGVSLSSFVLSGRPDQKNWNRNSSEVFSRTRPSWPMSEYLPLCDQLIQKLERTGMGKVCAFTQSNSIDIRANPQYLFRIISQLRFNQLELIECTQFQSNEVLFQSHSRELKGRLYPMSTRWPKD